MFDKTFHIRLDNMTQINIGGTWHPLTDVSHVTRGTGCVVNLKQLSMYFRVHWKKVQFKYALALIIIILTKTARKIFSTLKSLSGFDTSIGGFMLATVCFSGQLGSLGRIRARHAIAGSGVSNESRYVDNYKYYIYV